MKILFLGDSITDAGRFNDPEGLGTGYVRLVKEALKEDIVINKGVSGERTNEILKRLNNDVLTNDFETIFILAGINDVWFHFASPYKTTTTIIKNNYEMIINEVKKNKPDAKIVMLSPFAYQSEKFYEKWFVFLNETIDLIKSLAKKHQAKYLNLQEVLNKNLTKYKKDELLHDGVHPTEIGHQIIRDEILKIITNLKSVQ